MKLSIKLLLLCIALFLANPSYVRAQKKVRRIVKKHIKRQSVKKAKRINSLRYRHLPKRGKVLRKLGLGYRTIKFKGANVFIHNGVWYKPTKRDRFIVARAPIGVRINRLPRLAGSRILLGTKVYYYYYGTYYEQVDDSEEYMVVTAPIGAKIDALPEGYDTLKIKGITYYNLDDVYYQFVVNSDDDSYFIVIKNPLL
ncbi:DUF6515 family protein [Winogradskyella sp. R77965]|uniref:DUF6515 family protein n=1 Tax=Winogradskyella sp. R77965 TaxID=3093872 RepID=UPI0037DDB828